jgi:hypothetical protein
MTQEQKDQMMSDYGVTAETLEKLLNFTDGVAKEAFIAGSTDVLQHLIDWESPVEGLPEADRQRGMVRYIEFLFKQLRGRLKLANEADNQPSN